MWKYGLIVKKHSGLKPYQTVTLHEFFDDDGDGDFQASYGVDPAMFSGDTREEIVSALLDAVKDLAPDEVVIIDA